MRRISTLLAVLLLFTLSTGCGSTQTGTGTTVQIYYAASSDVQSGAAILSESVQLAEVSIPALLECQLRQPMDAELVQTIPDGTTVRSWELSNGLLQLDLSEEFGQLSGVTLIRAEYCIVLTVTQLDEVKRVAITVNGKRLPENGTRTLGANDAVFKGETDDPVTLGTKLYYPRLDGSGLESQFRQMELASLAVKDQANAILRELALAPEEHADTLECFLSGAGTINAVSVESGVCTLELDRSALEEICTPDASEQQIRLRIYAIVDSLSELDGIDEVSFLLDGEPIEGWQSVYSVQYEF